MKLSGIGAATAGLFLAVLAATSGCSAGTTGTNAADKSGIVADGQTSTELDAKEIAKKVDQPITVILPGKTGKCTAEPGSTLTYVNYDDKVKNGVDYVGVRYRKPSSTFKAPIQKTAKPAKAPAQALCSNFHGQDYSGHTGHVEKSIFKSLAEDTTAA